MIKVMFFARVRDMAGCSAVEIELPMDGATVADVRRHLMGLNEGMARALAADDISAALNQQQCDSNQVVANGDEVAFFPPVTGG